MATLTPSTDPYVILCGAGASGTGLLVAASQHGYLHKLAKRGGIVAYEKNEHTGGMLANTRIPSNSFASVFIECLPGLRTTFGEDCKELQLLEESKQVKIIKEIGKAAMELTHVGEYLKKLGNTVWNLCSNICRAELHLKHEVCAIHMLPGGGVEVTAVSSDGIETKRRCTKVVISMGGVQNLDVIEHIPITSDGLTLAAFRDNMVPSHEVVQRTDLIQRRLLNSTLLKGGEQSKPTITADHPIVIVGGSHSAWAAAYNFIDKLTETFDFEEGSIIIMHRSPIRMYYATLQEAMDAGYTVDPVNDVCPVTGRVNRYGGLRYIVNTLAQQVVLSGQEKRICTKMLLGGNSNSSDVVSVLSSASLIVAAIGYAARVPQLFDPRGKQMNLLSKFGQLTTNADGQCSDSNGTLLPDILAYGLGAGQFTNPEVGGESSFAGRVDGVWLYMNDMGKVLLRTLTNDDEPETKKEEEAKSPPPAPEAADAMVPSRSDRWRNIYTRKGNVADDKTPLHVLGGYDKFTLQQWLDQVSILVGDKGPAGDFSRNIKIDPSEKVLEVGSGGGAFIDALARIFGDFDMFGIDYCQSLVDRASARLQSGTFAQGDARNLTSVSFCTNITYDVVISFGVTQYLNDLHDVELKFAEMLRVAKSGARVVLCEVSDSAREHVANEIRAKAYKGVVKVSSDSPTHLYIPKTFWQIEMCNKYDVLLTGIVDHRDIGLNYATAPYRYSVFFTKK